MKTLISIIALSVATAWAPSLRADSGSTGQAQPSAALKWNGIALESVERAKPTQHQAIRLLAYLSIAQHAALTGTKSEQLSDDTVGTASMRVIAELLPAQAAWVEERLRQSGSRETDTGRRVAQNVLAQARHDGFALAGDGQAARGAYAWRSLATPPVPPAYPSLGAMRPFFLESGGVFRSAPPPALASARFRADLAEVQRHTESPTPESIRVAKFYDMTTGTLVAGFWNGQAAELIRAKSLGELQAADILATMNAAMMDAVVACHDTKYSYWVPRPSQADPSIKPVIAVPNHPSYPSNHSCISTAAALVLAHFFPADRGRLEGLSAEAGVSRIYAGLHYRFDVDAGEDIGRKVAALAIARHDEMLARWSGMPLAQTTHR